MSGSSSDSDSDDYEPVRKIKINIRPKDELVRKGAADVNEIRASIEAWRPLGPKPHRSLSRRQSSMSSVSSISLSAGGSIYNCPANASSNIVSTSTSSKPFGTANFNATLNSSPSCSSLVSEFSNANSVVNSNNGASQFSKPVTISNFTQRTTSPLFVSNLNLSDSISIAIAIQESIDLIIRGIYDLSSSEPKFNSRSFGKIKVAFPNTFAARCASKLNQAKSSATLKLLMHSTQNINRYYASGLIKDLDIINSDGASVASSDLSSRPNESSNNSKINGNTTMKGNLLCDLLDSPVTLTQATTAQSNSIGTSKTIEFDMENLSNQLSLMYQESPRSRYFNLDILKYQISSIKSIDECPLQLCAYWKIEPKLVKLRINFKHSPRSGLNLERLRDISFTVNFRDFIPPGIDISSMSPNSISTLKTSNNNNDSVLIDMNNFDIDFSKLDRNPTTPTMTNNQRIGHQEPYSDNLSSVCPTRSASTSSTSGSSTISSASQQQMRTLPSSPIATGQSKASDQIGKYQRLEPTDAFGAPIKIGIDKFSIENISDAHFVQNKPSNGNNLIMGPPTPAPRTSTTSTQLPYITHQPPGSWNNSIKQLTWKFDNLLSYYKSEGYGCLFAKLDFRQRSATVQQCKPPVVEAKFLVVDSTLSKTNIGVDSASYKMSLLKREVRSGCYRCEPYIL